MANPRPLMLSNAALRKSLKYRYFGRKAPKSLEKGLIGPQHEDFEKIWPLDRFGLAMAALVNNQYIAAQRIKMPFNTKTK
jgi:hypothetical protein